MRPTDDGDRRPAAEQATGARRGRAGRRAERRAPTVTVARPPTEPRAGAAPASRACCSTTTSDAPDDVGYRGPGRLRGRRDHLPPARLLGPHRTGRAERAPATGSGTQRLYGFRDILVLKVVKRLLDTGVSLQQIRQAVQHLRERGVEDLAGITLMSDGASVYECTSRRRGRRPGPGRPGRVRHRGRPRLARGRGIAVRAAERAGRRRARRADHPATSSPRGAQPAPPADRPTTDPPAAPPAPPPACAGDGVMRRMLLVLVTPHGRVPAHRRGRRRGNPPRNLSGARTVRARRLWSAARPGRQRGRPGRGRVGCRDASPMPPTHADPGAHARCSTATVLHHAARRPRAGRTVPRPAHRPLTRRPGRDGRGRRPRRASTTSSTEAVPAVDPARRAARAPAAQPRPRSSPSCTPSPPATGAWCR